MHARNPLPEPFSESRLYAILLPIMSPVSASSSLNFVMSLPIFFPVPVYVPQIRGRTQTIEELCRKAGVECRAIGNWISRPVVIRASGESLRILAEPGDWGAVEITVPASVKTERAQARLALGALAYSTLFDGVARASVAGQKWSRAAASASASAP